MSGLYSPVSEDSTVPQFEAPSPSHRYGACNSTWISGCTCCTLFASAFQAMPKTQLKLFFECYTIFPYCVSNWYKKCDKGSEQKAISVCIRMKNLFWIRCHGKPMALMPCELVNLSHKRFLWNKMLLLFTCYLFWTLCHSAWHMKGLNFVWYWSALVSPVMMHG